MALTIVEGNCIHVTGTQATTSAKIADTGQEAAGYFIKFIHWYKPSTVGHLLNLIDKNGVLIAKFYCDTADVSQWAPLWTRVNSIYCDDMDSGELLIYT